MLVNSFGVTGCRITTFIVAREFFLFRGRLMMQLPEKVEAAVVVMMIGELLC